MNHSDGARRRAALKAIASYLPAGTLTNEELARQLGGWDAPKILEKTGIAVRHIAAPGECSSDLGVAAAERLFETGASAPADIDFLLFCTQSPDYFLPTTACLVQERLGLRLDCGALDFNQGCSGFVYGLSLAKSLIETGHAANVLLITAETYSKFINRRDRSVRTIFGDGAAATLLSAVESERELIGPFIFGTDGRGARELIVPAGGLRQPVGCEQTVETEDSRGNWRSERNLYMNGPEVYRFTVETVPPLLEQLLQKSGWAVEDVDHFIFHQANKFMLDRLRARTPIPEEKFWVDMEDCANTVSSTIPIALEKAHCRGRIRAGHRLALVGFGVGYSWAGAMIEWVGP
ncbi:MAG TPA: ketoacyl-ACP synthase III [Terriglobales bacterium]|nr:ketoacyl-ACP synthase III [Terriglobales bacterium]